MKSVISRVALALIAVAGVFVAVNRPLAAAPAAVLTSCKGDVTVVRAGATAPASFGLPLNDGDEVKTGAGSEAEIMFSAGNWVQVGANSSMKIKGHPGTPGGEKTEPSADTKAAKSGSFDVVQNFLKLKNSEGTSAIGGLRSGEKPPVLEPVAPSQTRVRTAQPTFRWKIKDPSTELRFTLYGEQKTVWTTEVTNVTELAYPADAPALKPGVTYSWTLETADPLVSPPLRTPASFFEVITPADVETLDTDLSKLEANKPGPVSYHLMRASLFFDRGLVADAIAETESAVASDPDNPSLHTILGRLYAEAGRNRDAVEEMGKGQK
jgi:hypothetical protein